jgi:hypothetical protein
MNSATVIELVAILRNLAETARDINTPQFSDPGRLAWDVNAAWETLNRSDIKPLWNGEE